MMTDKITPISDMPARRPRGGRLFDHGGLRFVLLRLIADAPSHGYELIKTIEQRSGGAYSPSPGVIYPTLTLLEEQGHVSASAETGARRRYAVTAEGLAALAANQEIVEAMFARLDDAPAINQPRPPQIVRAMENLKLALRLRFADRPVTDDQATAIARILDAAAQQVEQVR